MTFVHKDVLGASVAEWLENVVTMGEVSGSIPGWGGHKAVGVRNLLTTSLSAGLSKDSGSLHLKNIQSQEQHNNISLQTLYKLELHLCQLTKVSSYNLHNTPSVI